MVEIDPVLRRMAANMQAFEDFKKATPDWSSRGRPEGAVKGAWCYLAHGGRVMDTPIPSTAVAYQLLKQSEKNGHTIDWEASMLFSADAADEEA